MLARHIQVARESGAKAGFNQYRDFVLGSTIPSVVANREDMLSSGNRKAQFEWYCNKFGSHFSNGRRARTVVAEANRSESTLLSKLAEALGLTTREVADAVGVEVFEDEPVVEAPTPREVREVPAATRISWPMAMSLKRIATKAGESFEIVGKTGKGRTANYGIKVGGRKLTPAQASARIGASKS